MRDILIKNFLRIANIPRESGNEEKIADFFVDVAEKNKLYCYKDQNNNVFIKKKGTIQAEPIILQAHLDMVCVNKKGYNHNFKEDGIEVVINGDSVTSQNTSLGADQGVGLAIILTIIEDNTLKHPDLEIILTVEEETTFKGAITFPYSMISSKRAINLDNYKDDCVFVGADGDICNKYTCKGNLIKCADPSYRIVLDGFKGGNSGENIEQSKENAITTVAQILYNEEILLKSINGGLTENDIATSCEIVINTNKDVYKIFNEYKVTVEEIYNDICFSKADTEKILKQILSLKCGYLTQNGASGNLGVAKTCNDVVELYYIFKSSEEEVLKKIDKEIDLLNNGFCKEKVYDDPIWKPDNASKLLKLYREIYKQNYQTNPTEAICSGCIECSAIKKEIENLDIISIGCNIENFHTSDEKTYINSWLKIYKLVKELLEKLD